MSKQREAKIKYWEGVDPIKRSEIARQIALKRWRHTSWKDKKGNAKRLYKARMFKKGEKMLQRDNTIL